MVEMLVDNIEVNRVSDDVISIPTSLNEAVRDSVAFDLNNRGAYEEKAAISRNVQLAVDLINESSINNSEKESLKYLLSPDYSSLKSADQEKLVNSIIRLHDRVKNEHLASKSSVIPKEEIIDSVLQSVAKGYRNFGQGNVPSCTATSAGIMFIKHKGPGAYAELMTDLLLDGYHNFNGNSSSKITLNESGIRRESANGLYKGASVAECIFRASMMEFSCRGLEASDPRMNFKYDDLSGKTYIFDKEAKPIGSFGGMHLDGFLYSMERMFGCGVEYLATTNDKLSDDQDIEKLFNPGEVLRELMNTNSPAGIELSYAKTGAHMRHFCVFEKVEDGRVYFKNPHTELTDINFVKISDSHRLENGLESLSIEDFKQKLLGASIVREGTEIGSFDEKNKAQQPLRSTEYVVDWYLDNTHAHVDVHLSVSEISAINLKLSKISRDEKNSEDETSTKESNIFYNFKKEEDMSFQELADRQDIEEKLRAALLAEMHAQRTMALRDEQFLGIKATSVRPDSLLN